MLRFRGDEGQLMPRPSSTVCTRGIFAESAKVALSGAISPAGLSTFTSRYTMMELARKLNMIVVITTWLPR